MTWPHPICSLLEMAWAWPSCLTDTAKLSGHVRTVSYKKKIKETGACARHSFRVLLLGFDSPGTDGFPKAAMQNHEPQGSLSLFILFCLASLCYEWKILKLNLTCMMSCWLLYLARNQLFILSKTNIRFQCWNSSLEEISTCVHELPFPLQNLQARQLQFVIFISSEHH